MRRARVRVNEESMAGRHMTAAITFNPQEVSTMKLMSIFAVTIGVAAGWKDMADSGVLMRSLGAAPEALLIGGSLLAIAAVLRLRVTGPAN